MKKNFSSDAFFAVMQDAQQFKRTCHWSKVTVEIYSDFIDASYRTADTIRSIPVNNADEWRLFASGDEIEIVFTYSFDDEKKC